jgi:hypothetical protein
MWENYKVLLLAVAVFLLLALLLGGGFVYFTMVRTQAERAEAEAREAERVAGFEACAKSLPYGMTMVHEFADSPQVDGFGIKRVSIKTVKQKLVELRAYCKDGSFYDENNRPITFYQMLEWGNPPAGYEDLLRKEREEIDRWQREGRTVIRMWRPVAPY